MIRPLSLGLLVASILGYGLFMLKYEVQSLKNNLSGLNAEIAAERESLHVLKAEWSYLNRPSYLEGLAANHLGLKWMGEAARVTPASLPMRAVSPTGEMMLVGAQAPQGGGLNTDRVLAGSGPAFARPVPVPVGFRRSD